MIGGYYISFTISIFFISMLVYISIDISQLYFIYYILYFIYLIHVSIRFTLVHPTQTIDLMHCLPGWWLDAEAAPHPSPCSAHEPVTPDYGLAW